mgnify:CR=1 FL=1
MKMKNFVVEEKTKLEEFEDLVAHHDLTYSYSDDHRYWTKGEESMKKIRALMKELPKEECVKIWNKYVDKKILPGSREMFYWE